MSLIPSQGTKIPYALGQLSPRTTTREDWALQQRTSTAKKRINIKSRSEITWTWLLWSEIAVGAGWGGGSRLRSLYLQTCTSSGQVPTDTKYRLVTHGDFHPKTIRSTAGHLCLAFFSPRFSGLDCDSSLDRRHSARLLPPSGVFIPHCLAELHSPSIIQQTFYFLICMSYKWSKDGSF